MTTTLERVADNAVNVEHASPEGSVSGSLCGRWVFGDFLTGLASFPAGTAQPCVGCHRLVFGVQRSARLLRDTTEEDRRRARAQSIPDDEGFVTIDREYS